MAAKKRARKKISWKPKGGFIVAIDGPSGAGKSTVSRQLADILGGRLLDTGAMYRSVAYFSVKEDAEEEEAISRIARRLKFTATPSGEGLLIDGEDMGLKLRSERVSALASSVSRIGAVREVLTKKQRALAKSWSRSMPVVVEGRDIGTVVFPKVEFKFFVTADPKVRAERRYHQLKKQGASDTSLKEVLESIENRDHQDSNRKLAPLQCPDDAVVVDTSSMGISQVVTFMRDHIRGHRLLLNIEKKRRS